MRLAAPLQSWGYDAKFERRGTGRMPTKSAVLGMACAALGIRRPEFTAESEDPCVRGLLNLRFGVRADRPGILVRDYHTARDAKRKSAYVTQRYYLSDATFLVGLESEDDELLTRIDCALRHPVYPLFLGRRSCPPAGKISLGIRTGKSLVEALREEPRLAYPFRSQKDGPLLMEIDAKPDADGAVMRRDLPLSFDQAHRRFGFRAVCERECGAVPPPQTLNKDSTRHDAMEAVRGDS